MVLTETVNEILNGMEGPASGELSHSLLDLFSGNGIDVCSGYAQRLGRGVYRLRFRMNGSSRSLIVKRLNPEIAKRNSLVANRWLPAIGLGQNGPPLLRSAAERNGQCVWHIYDDLGDWGLKESSPKLEYVRVAVELVATMHARFVGHPWLAECRLWGGDLGVSFYSNSVHDAIANLERLSPPYVELNSDHTAMRDRLLRRLHIFQNELPHRLEVVREFSGPETLLHGDLWPQNVFVIPSPEGPRVRMIDWDHASAGPVMYDLSTFLSRFPVDDRLRIFDMYREAPETTNWQIPSRKKLNLLFETLECARVANCVIWPAIEVQESQTAWAFEELKEIDEWFEALQPILPV